VTDPNRYEVTKADLDRAAADLRDARADFDRLSASLRSDIDSLRSRWQGAGAAAFHRLSEQWDTRYRTVTRVLDRFGDSVGVNVTVALGNDDDVASDLGGLASHAALNH